LDRRGRSCVSQGFVGGSPRLDRKQAPLPAPETDPTCQWHTAFQLEPASSQPPPVPGRPSLLSITTAKGHSRFSPNTRFDDMTGIAMTGIVPDNRQSRRSGSPSLQPPHSPPRLSTNKGVRPMIFGESIPTPRPGHIDVFLTGCRGFARVDSRRPSAASWPDDEKNGTGCGFPPDIWGRMDTEPAGDSSFGERQTPCCA